MGRGYVDIYKINEDNNFVWYRFERSIIEKRFFEKPSDVYPKVTRRIVNGYCKINKQTGEFILDRDNTDSYFFDDSFWVGAVQVKLFRFFKAGLDFPDATCWAS